MKPWALANLHRPTRFRGNPHWGTTPPAKQSAPSPSSSSAGKVAPKELVQKSLWPAFQMQSVLGDSEGENAVNEGKSGTKAQGEQHQGDGESEDIQEFSEVPGEGNDMQEENEGKGDEKTVWTWRFRRGLLRHAG